MFRLLVLHLRTQLKKLFQVELTMFSRYVILTFDFFRIAFYYAYSYLFRAHSLELSILLPHSLANRLHSTNNS